MQHPACFNRRAFTLVELLTVIAIIAILAAILVASLASVREKARTSQCAANLRSWGNATHLYVAEHKGRLPASVYATTKIENVENMATDAYSGLLVYVVPPTHPMIKWGYNSDDLAGYMCSNREIAAGNMKWGSYGFNVYPSQLPMTTISKPSQMVWATELAANKRWLDFSTLATHLVATTTKPHGDANNNVLYLDGHVRTQKVADLLRADFTRDTSAYLASHETQRVVN